MNSLPARLRTPTALSAARRDAHRSGTSGRGPLAAALVGFRDFENLLCPPLPGLQLDAGMRSRRCRCRRVRRERRRLRGWCSPAPAWTSAPRPVVRRMRSRRVRRLASSSGCGGGVGMVGADGRSGRGAHRRAVDAPPRRAPARRWRPLLMLAAATPQRRFVVAAVRFSHGGLLAVVRRCVGCDRCVCFARSMSRCEGMPVQRLHRTAAATDGGGAARRGAGVEPEGCPFGAGPERRLAAEPRLVAVTWRRVRRCRVEWPAGVAPGQVPRSAAATGRSPGGAAYSGSACRCSLRQRPRRRTRRPARRCDGQRVATRWRAVANRRENSFGPIRGRFAAEARPAGAATPLERR